MSHLGNNKHLTNALNQSHLSIRWITQMENVPCRHSSVCMYMYINWQQFYYIYSILKKQTKKQTKNKDKLSYYSLWEASHLALPFLEKSIFVYQQIYSEGIIWKERNSLSNGTVHVTLATKFMAKNYIGYELHIAP